MDQQEKEWQEAMAAVGRERLEKGLIMVFIDGPRRGTWMIACDPPAEKFGLSTGDILAGRYYRPWDVKPFYTWVDESLSTRPT